MLLKSENLFMKMKIDQLEFDLESERIRSRHFEGMSHIAMIELQKGTRVTYNSKSSRIVELLGELQVEMKQFEVVKADISNCVNKIEAIVGSIHSILQ